MLQYLVVEFQGILVAGLANGDAVGLGLGKVPPDLDQAGQVNGRVNIRENILHHQ